MQELIIEDERIKELKIDIMDNIEMTVHGMSLATLHELKEKLGEEPSFIEQFNY